MLDYHIYRITRDDHIVISAAPATLPEFHNEVIASFKTNDLRNLALAAYATEIESKADLYPRHKVRNRT